MRTRKVSISIDSHDLVVLRRIAKAEHGGNLSALFASGVAPLLERERTKKERAERRRELLAWLGPPPTKEESEAIAAVIEGRATKKQQATYDRLETTETRTRKIA
ncbi:hypothetical protein [Pendulispora albinea]|uniref:Uncharacterized protein n=1 Tax=Pendulispora albinea TaxID=2741071 RepID=A0ABZ2LXN0_9BACT